MASTKHRQVVLVARPEGIPLAEHFAIVTVQVREPEAGEVLVRNEFLSVDPAMRGRVDAAANYADPVPLGSVMRSFAVGTVEASRAEGIAVGETVVGMFGWQERATVPATAILRRVSRGAAPVSTALGVLGLTGATAWFGLTEIGRPTPGDTVVVSTAAGSVGAPRPVNSPASQVAARSASRGGRRRCACASRSSATTQRSTIARRASRRS